MNTREWRGFMILFNPTNVCLDISFAIRAHSRNCTLVDTKPKITASHFFKNDYLERQPSSRTPPILELQFTLRANFRELFLKVDASGIWAFNCAWYRFNLARICIFSGVPGVMKFTRNFHRDVGFQIWSSSYSHVTAPISVIRYVRRWYSRSAIAQAETRAGVR